MRDVPLPLNRADSRSALRLRAAKRRGSLLAGVLLAALPAPASAAWTPSNPVSPVEHETVRGGDIASDGQGRVTGFWTWFGSSAKHVSSADRPAGGAFATPFAVHDFGDGFTFPNPGQGNEPEIAVNASGAAIAAYVVGSGSSETVYVVHRSSASAPWSARRVVRTAPQVKRVEVAILPDGSGWVAWLDRDADPGDEVRASRIGVDGTPAASALAYAMPFSSVSGAWSLTADPKNNAAAILISSSSLDGEGLTLVRSSANGWSTPVPLTPASDPTYDGQAQAAFEADGDLRVAFVRGSSGDGAVRSGLVADGTSTLVHSEVDPSRGFSAIRGLELGVDQQGAAALAWIYEKQSSPSRTDLRAAALDAGSSTWGSVADLHVDARFPQHDDAFDPDVVVAPDGAATVGWVAPGATGGPRAAERRAGGAWSGTAVLPLAEGFQAYRIELTQAPSGIVHAVYLQAAADSTALVHTSTEPFTAPPDAAGPQITISTPAIGQRFTQGQVVLADYACTDDVAVALCQGNVADGARLDTSTVGQHSFTVLTRDTAGKESTRAHGYFVDAPPAGGGGTDAGGGTGQTPTAGTGQPSDGGTASAVAQRPITVAPSAPYKELSPAQRAQLAQANLGASAKQAITQTPPSVPATSLIKGGVSLPVFTARPNVEITGGFVGLIGSASGNLIGSASGNLIGPASGNLLGPAANNLISDNGLGVVASGGANLRSASSGGSGSFRAAAAKRPRKATVLGKGAKFFAEPGSGRIKVKLNAKGKKALKKAFAKKGRQEVKLTYVLVFSQRGSDLPGLYGSRTITIRE